MKFPGYELAAYFQLEIAFSADEQGGRENIENVILSTNSFPLPEIETPPVEVYWGPGMPAIHFPGNIRYSNIDVELTPFYERDTYHLFLNWNYNVRMNYWDNVKDGWVIGFSDAGEAVFKAALYSMWPSKVSKGGTADEASDQRNTMNITLHILEVQPIELD